MNSFRRVPNSKKSPTLPGVKPWLSGSNIITSGNTDLDRVLNGGLFLSSSILIEEDNFTQFAKDLERSYIMGSIKSDQPCFIFYSSFNSGLKIESLLSQCFRHYSFDLSEENKQKEDEDSFYSIVDAETFIKSSLLSFEK